jgi:hypothetical protein
MKNFSVKHTPGPWSFDEAERQIWNVDTEIPICEIWYARQEDHYAANARLIAATPDLLKALEAVLNHDREEDSEDIVIRFNCAQWLELLVAERKAKG